MLSRFEIFKDTLQVAVESGAARAGRIATLITDAVREVAREIGGWATDVFEAVDAAQRADAARQLRRDATPHMKAPRPRKAGARSRRLTH